MIVYAERRVRVELDLGEVDPHNDREIQAAINDALGYVTEDQWEEWDECWTQVFSVDGEEL